MAVNGSSSIGRCSILILDTKQTCFTPARSVLFDGNVPTLTGIDGDMWASRLFTINTTANTANITFDFTTTPNYTGVERVEVVMFNCPEWGISVRIISLFGAISTSGGRRFLTSISPTTTSCDSLVRVCISNTVSSIRPVLTLVFIPHLTSNWVHFAEVTFYANGSTCPPDTIIIPPPTTPTTQQMNTPLTTPEMIVTATTRTEEVATRTTGEITTGKILNKPPKVCWT